MTEPVYNVEIVAQDYDTTTLAKLAALFKKAEHQIAAALAKGNIVAKKDLNQSDAEKYQFVIEQRTGADCIVTSPFQQLNEHQEVVKPAATKAHPPATEPTMRLKSKLIYLSAALTLAVILAAGGAYKLWTTTPAYSLLQINHAVQRNDLSLFQEHVDYNSLISRGLEAVIAAQLTSTTAPGNAWEAVGIQIGKGLANLMVPTLTKNLGSELEKIITQGGDPSFTALPRLTAISAALSAVERQGNRAYAHATVTFPKFENKTFTLIFSLKKHDNYWQIFEVKNLLDFIEWQTEQEAYYLDKTNQPILAGIASSIGRVDYAYKRMQTNPFLGPELRIAMNIENASDRAIKTLYCDIQVRRDDGSLLAEQSLSWGDGTRELEPGEYAQITKNLTTFANPDLKNALDNPETKLTVEYQISSISFADGSELVLYRSFADIP